jgi:hypothetical protein
MEPKRRRKKMTDEMMDQGEGHKPVAKSKMGAEKAPTEEKKKTLPFAGGKKSHTVPGKVIPNKRQPAKKKSTNKS